jgi:SagB-type dehydrogenase family enzyme
MEAIDLPAPALEGPVSLEETLSDRRSVREFTDETLMISELSQLFWATQGLTRQGRGRTNPSAGALYPLEVYAATSDGLYHYLPDGHRAELLSTEDLRTRLYLAAHRQDAVRDAPAVFVICGVFARTAGKYGDRAVRYVHLEAGHVGQSLVLQAVALELGGVTVGAFLDGRVREVLGLPDDHEPLYLIPIGHPAS